MSIIAVAAADAISTRQANLQLLSSSGANLHLADLFFAGRPSISALPPARQRENRRPPFGLSSRGMSLTSQPLASTFPWRLLLLGEKVGMRASFPQKQICAPVNRG